MISPTNLIGTVLLVALAGAVAGNWPEGYVVHENTESPDGRYGIIVPDDEPTDGNSESVNYLSDLKTHQALGKIKGSDYYEHQNHAGLNVVWADDSSWCVAEYEGRFGFASISILEPKGSTFTDTDIGEKIDKTLAAVIRKQSHDLNEHGYAVTYFRLGDRKLQIRAAATTDPKQMLESGGYYALFQGTFDVRTRKWLATDARSLNRDQYLAADTAFSDLDTQLAHTAFEMQDKTQWLDERMNEVYNIVRAVLPPNRFAKVKQEQTEWLKKRDAVGSVEEKQKLMDARIRALQELLW